jgi:cytochrome c553
MQTLVSLLNPVDMEKVAVYYATLEPKKTPHKAKGDVQAGKDIVPACASCHGNAGNSVKPDTPSLAGQDPAYLLKAIQDYKKGKRPHETMQNAVKELSAEQIQNLVAYYTAQTPQAAEDVHIPQPPEAVAEQCERCHGENGHSTDPAVPIIAGQVRGYLLKALQEYRSGERQNSMMHAMSGVLSDVEQHALAGYFSNQPHNAGK